MCLRLSQLEDRQRNPLGAVSRRDTQVSDDDTVVAACVRAGHKIHKLKVNNWKVRKAEAGSTPYTPLRKGGRQNKDAYCPLDVLVLRTATRMFLSGERAGGSTRGGTASILVQITSKESAILFGLLRTVSTERATRRRVLEGKGLEDTDYWSRELAYLT